MGFLNSKYIVQLKIRRLYLAVLWVLDCHTMEIATRFANQSYLSRGIKSKFAFFKLLRCVFGEFEDEKWVLKTIFRLKTPTKPPSAAGERA